MPLCRSMDFSVPILMSLVGRVTWWWLPVTLSRRQPSASNLLMSFLLVLLVSPRVSCVIYTQLTASHQGLFAQRIHTLPGTVSWERLLKPVDRWWRRWLRKSPARRSVGQTPHDAPPCRLISPARSRQSFGDMSLNLVDPCRRKNSVRRHRATEVHNPVRLHRALKHLRA